MAKSQNDLTKEDTLLEALNEVLEDIKGTKTLKGRSVIIDDINVHDIREKYHLTQVEFSKLFGFSLRTLQQWEQGRRRPQGAARVFLKVIDSDPEAVTRALHR
jgi:putative transcriptional regulator